MNELDVRRWYEQKSQQFSGSIPWEKLPEQSRAWWRQRYAERPQERVPYRKSF